MVAFICEDVFKGLLLLLTRVSCSEATQRKLSVCLYIYILIDFFFILSVYFKLMISAMDRQQNHIEQMEFIDLTVRACLFAAVLLMLLDHFRMISLTVTVYKPHSPPHHHSTSVNCI